MKNIAKIFIICLILFSCEGNLKGVQNIYKTTFVATGEVDSFNVKYLDSGIVKSNLKSLKMLDYSTAKNPFIEFPNGILVTLYDKEKVTTVVSDFATSYKRTQIIDLQYNVKITTHDGKKLETDQLYFDQKNEWFFTESPFKFTDSDGGFLQGVGIDFSKDFKVFNMQKNTGEVNNIK
jgi:LPS export ABC transporter protein LptC